MNEYFYGFGTGRLSQEEISFNDNLAKENDSVFVCLRGTSQGRCQCNMGCSRDTCPVMTFWYQTNNKDLISCNPFNERRRYVS